MTSNLLKFFVQLTIIILLYYLFARYNLEYLFIIIASLLLVVFIIFNRSKSQNKEIYLEIACDANKYLETLEKTHKDKDDINQYQLQQAYGYLFKGEFAKVKELLAITNVSEVENQHKYYLIHTKIKAKLAFEDKDEFQLKQLLNEVVEQEEVDELLRDYIKVLILLVKEEWDHAISLLMDTIPVQRTRVYIIELEYYLAYAYVQFNQLEDAQAVLEFVVKKGHRIVYTDLCYDLYMKIKED